VKICSTGRSPVLAVKNTVGAGREKPDQSTCA
jgi:hypothetical protein